MFLSMCGVLIFKLWSRWKVKCVDRWMVVCWGMDSVGLLSNLKNFTSTQPRQPSDLLHTWNTRKIFKKGTKNISHTKAFFYIK